MSINRHHNDLGQAVGFPVPDWQPRPRPSADVLEGRYCRLEPIDPERHAAQLHAANGQDGQGRIWTYLAYGPFATLADYRHWLESECLSDDPQFYAVVDARNQQALGVASYLRIQPSVGVIEVGHINFSPLLQKTPAATEAMFLMMQRVFDELGYRRYEWKCDALNAASRSAAQRLGFTFEGIFRQATLYKKRNRDTAWYSVIDSEWPRLKTAFQHWLSPQNFDDRQRQKQNLASFR